jgi:hypothetical protein
MPIRPRAGREGRHIVAHFDAETIVVYQGPIGHERIHIQCPLARGCGRGCVRWALAPPTAPPVEQAAKGNQSGTALSAPPGNIAW